MALIFKIDESYDNEKSIMLVGGWLMEEKQWAELEKDWQDCIDATNQASRPDQQISRFHATELNGFKEEFKNWDKSLSEAFTGKLVKIVKDRPTVFVVAAVNAAELVKVFPAQSDSKLESAYGLCIKQLMLSLGHVIHKQFVKDKVAVVFESGNWDQHAYEAYKQMIADPKFKDRDLFQSFTSLTCKQSIGLQAADLIAYESMRRVKSLTKQTDAKLRWALRELLGAKHLGESAYIDRNALIALSGN